jgi:hypothetical protein
MSDFQDKASGLIEEMQRNLHERMLAQLDAAATGTVSSLPGPTLVDVKSGLDRCAELMRQMRDTPELRFQQTRLIPRGQMFELKTLQRDQAGQAFRLVFIHPDDVPAVRAALLEQPSSDPSIIRPLLPLGLEPEGPLSPEQRDAALKWLESLP